VTRILAYRFSAFGDVAMTAPVFREFLEQNPDVEIVMVSRKNFESLFADIPNVIFKGIDLDEYKGFFGLTRLANELVKEFHPDLIANLHDVIRTKILDKIYRRKGLKVFKINKGRKRTPDGYMEFK
jgi:ADP-heptose:LPS heptosyltransferase